VDLELENIKKTVILKGNFLFPVSNKLIIAKHNNSKAIYHICAVELAEAIYGIANVLLCWHN